MAQDTTLLTKCFIFLSYHGTLYQMLHLKYISVHKRFRNLLVATAYFHREEVAPFGTM